jgi:excisionase family DNA binding protein
MLELPAAGDTSTPERVTALEQRLSVHHESQLTVAEAATRLELTKSTVLRYIHSGQLKAVKQPGQFGEQWMIPVTEVARLAPENIEPRGDSASLPGVMGEEATKSLISTMDALVQELAKSRLQITAGDERVANERESRARAEERLQANEALHRMEVANLEEIARRETANLEQRRIGAERERKALEDHASAMEAWSLIAQRRRFRKPPPPPTKPIFTTN